MAAIKLKSRILLPFVAASLFLFVFLLVLNYQEESGHIDQELERGGRTLQAVYAAQLHERAQKMQAALDFLEQDSALQRAFAARDRARLLALAEPAFQRLRRELNITHFYFLDPQRLCVLRVHQPPRYGDVIERYTALEAERTGRLAYGAELGPLGTFTLRVVIPWRVAGQLLGYLELGEETEDVIKHAAAIFGIDLALLVDKRFLSRSDWEAGMRMLGREAHWDQLGDAVIPFHTLGQWPADLLSAPHDLWAALFPGRHSYWTSVLPLQDAGQRQVGRILLVRDLSQRSHQLFGALAPMATVALVVGLLLFTLFFFVLDRAERKMAAWEGQLRQEVQTRAGMQEEHIRELERLALYDPLTGLPNRKLLHDRIEHAIALAQRDQEVFALVSVDLHRLREINDTLGHDTGDVVLQQVAQRLRQGLRKSDTVARPGGDEFAILLPAVAGGVVLAALEKLQQLLSEPFQVQSLTLDIGATFGVALYPEHGSDASTLLRRVDVALRHAKSVREGYAVYDSERDPHSLRRLNLFGELRKAIHDGSLQLYYQPQLVLASGRVERVEALARWHHPQQGFISPEEFIPLAEHTGLIRSFTVWALGEALRQCRQWQDQGLTLQVAVNLSTQNLLDDSLPEMVADLLERWQLDSGQLLLEITESAFLHEPARALAVLRRLDEMGLSLSIDDFGTGYSSLAYLKQLPVRELKIDRSFVGDMLRDDSDAKIVASTIGLAHNLGLTVVAEGVESADVQQALIARGCDVIQGYHISRPLPPQQLEPWLRGTNTPA